MALIEYPRKLNVSLEGTGITDAPSVALYMRREIVCSNLKGIFQDKFWSDSGDSTNGVRVESFILAIVGGELPILHSQL